MGTYRRFSLTTNEEKGFELFLIEQFRNDYSEAETYLDEQGNSNGECSWMEHEIQLAEFSKRYPETLFSLWVHDDGTADDEDEWVVYAHNGKIQLEEPEKHYPEFDITKVREPKKIA